MTSLFADQFGYARPYGLGPLATGVPQVGVRLPEAKPKGSSTGTGVRTGARSMAGAGAASAIAAGAASGIAADASQSGTVGAQGARQAAQRGALSKSMHLPDTFAGDTSTVAPTPVSAPSRPSIFGEPTHPANPSLWNVIGHGFKNEFDSILNNAPVPIDPAVRKVTPRTTDEHVTEPSRVFQNDPGAFTRPASATTGRAAAIDMSPYSPQFKASFGHEAARFGQASGEASDLPSSKSIWDDFGAFLDKPVDFLP